MNAGCAASIEVYLDRRSRRFAGAIDCSALFTANDTFAFFVKAGCGHGDHEFRRTPQYPRSPRSWTTTSVINYHFGVQLYRRSKHQTDTSVLAGAYQLNPSDGLRWIVDALAITAKLGRPLQITIPEGYSILADPSVAAGQLYPAPEDALDEVLNDYSFEARFPGG